MSRITTFRDFSLGVDRVRDPRRMQTTRASQRSVSYAEDADFLSDGTIRSRLYQYQLYARAGDQLDFFPKMFVHNDLLWGFLRGSSYLCAVDPAPVWEAVASSTDAVPWPIHHECRLDFAAYNSPTESPILSSALLNGVTYVSAADLYPVTSFGLWNDERYVFGGADYYLRSFAVNASNELVPWGIPKPRAGDFFVQTHPNGSLHAGTYQLNCTFVYGGVEGPASDPIFVDLGVSCGIEVTVDTPHTIPAHEIRLYLTPADAHTPYYVGSIVPAEFDDTYWDGPVPLPIPADFLNAGIVYLNQRALITTLDVGAAELQTAFLDQPPQASVVVAHNSILLLAEGSTLWMTVPFAPHLVDPATGFFQFGGKINAVVSVGTGVYVSADKLYFLADLETETPSQREASPTPAHPGTMTRVSNGTAYWYTTDGFCSGSQSGEVKYVTESTYKAELEGSAVASVVHRDGQELVVVSAVPHTTPTFEHVAFDNYRTQPV